MDNEIKNKYIFIGGSGRSGTNIVKEILSKNSNVSSLNFEHRFTIDPDGIIDFYNSFSLTWSPYMTDIKLKRLKSFLINLAKNRKSKKSYQGWELDNHIPKYSKNVQMLVDELKNFQYKCSWPGRIVDSSNYQLWFSKPYSKSELAKILGSFITTNFDSIIKKNKKKIFVEDNTWNVLFAKEISELVPKSKMLHIIRDPRDVIASFVKQRWCPTDLQQAIFFYKSIFKRWFEIEKTLPDNYFSYVKLENLVSDRERYVNEICIFVDLPFENSMLKIDLSHSNQGRWEKDFSNKEKKIIGIELAEILAWFNCH